MAPQDQSHPVSEPLGQPDEVSSTSTPAPSGNPPPSGSVPGPVTNSLLQSASAVSVREDEADEDADGAESAGNPEHEASLHSHQEHPAKRARLTMPETAAAASESQPHRSLDDEAVLALAAHNGAEATDQYGPGYALVELAARGSVSQLTEV